MSLTESLTQRKVIELKTARKMCDFRNVWSNDGKILFLDIKGALSGLRHFLAIESHLKMMKNAFYFTSKALFILKIFKFLS